MDHLTMDITRICRRNRQGSHATQANRRYGLTAAARDLRHLGFNLKSAQALKPKHVDALVAHWQSEELTDATLRNRMAWLRWLAEQTGKANIIKRDNGDYGLARRQNKVQKNRAFELSEEKLAKIHCPRVKAALLMQSAFGLRREEALKFQPIYGIRSNCIALKPSWTKGRHYREVPISTPQQRSVLKVVRQLAGTGSLVPENMTYVEMLKRYEHETSKAGIVNAHGLRHHWAQLRYAALTGMQCPFMGGKSWHAMTKEERAKDRLARQQIAQELGHGRMAISNVYLGRAMS